MRLKPRVRAGAGRTSLLRMFLCWLMSLSS
jgi:hypothetical protein